MPPPPWQSQRGHFEVKKGHPDFFTNNMIFLECGVIALFEAFYFFTCLEIITMLK